MASDRQPRRTRGGGGDRHPLNDPTPAGATDARVGAPIERGPCGLAHGRFVNCRDGRDARPVEVEPPAGATDAGGTSPKLLSAATEWQGDKAHVVPFLHANQHAALAFRFGTGNDIADVRGR